MDVGLVIEIAQRTLYVLVLLIMPLLGLSLVVGLAISVFQATTQIQEQTLVFVPKILSIIVGIAVFGGWMLRILMDFTQDLYMNINTYIR